jgi:ABC-type enterobactin transport system permease subunit
MDAIYFYAYWLAFAFGCSALLFGPMAFLFLMFPTWMRRGDAVENRRIGRILAIATGACLLFAAAFFATECLIAVVNR